MILLFLILLNKCLDFLVLDVEEMLQLINLINQDVSLVVMSVLDILDLSVLIEIKLIFQSEQFSLVVNLKRTDSIF